MRTRLTRSCGSFATVFAAGLLLIGLPANGDGDARWPRASVTRAAVCKPPFAELLNRGRQLRQGRCIVRGAAGADGAGTAVINKPDLDRRQYRHVVLSNGLEVLLASDPEAENAAAAMSIKAGSFDEPAEFLGLAHFHEHMLFLGTDKYPDEDEYNRYLKDHGGYSNAFTADETTNYYFRVNAPHLMGALDRFAQFFLAPTFDSSAIDREMHAVDSENTNYASDEYWRRLQIMKATAQEEHPFHRFSVGNLQTLGHSGEEVARTALLSWNAEHYHAGAMRLAVTGREPLDDLEASVSNLFSAVRDGPATKVETPAPSSQRAPLAWPQEQLGVYVEVVPKIEERSISVAWPLPSALKHLYGKLEDYISHSFGHEGEGSLHALLNKEGLIEELMAGSSQSFEDSQLFSIDISLTREGEGRVGEVLDRLFAYVAVLREAGPRAETFEELRLLREIGFRFLEESPAPENTMAAASSNMHYYPARDALRGPSALDQWLPEELAAWLGQLTPERCIVVQASPDFSERAEAAEAAQQGWTSERWYGALFRRRPLSEEELARWASPAGEARDGLVVPADNPFVPHDFRLRCDDLPGTSEPPKTALEVTPPTELRPADSAASGFLRLWSKTDSTFRVPKVHVNTHVMTPIYSMGPAAVVMLRLFCSLLSDDLNTFLYSATTAGLSYNVQFSDRFSFAVGGFSDKLPELLAAVAGRLRSLQGELAEAAGEQSSASATELREYWAERLDTQRELLLRSYENFFKEDPLDVVDYNLRQVLLANMWHISEYVDVLNGTDGERLLQPLSEKVSAALSRIRLEVLAHGNVVAKETEDMAKVITSSFVDEGASEPLPDAELPKNSVVLLPPEPQGVTVFDFDLEAVNPVEENSAIANLYQVGPVGKDLQRDASLFVLAHLADTSAFDQLRTKEQLGYVASAGLFRFYGVDSLIVQVQGPRLSPAGLDERIEAWLVQFRAELEAMPEETFAANVRALVQVRSQRDKMLAQEVGRHWEEIVKRTYRFDRLRAEVAALGEVTQKDVLALFDSHIAMGGELRRKLSSRVTGAAARKSDSKTPTTSENVRLLRTLDEVRSFKGSLPTHSEG